MVPDRGVPLSKWQGIFFKELGRQESWVGQLATECVLARMRIASACGSSQSGTIEASTAHISELWTLLQSSLADDGQKLLVMQNALA